MHFLFAAAVPNANALLRSVVFKQSLLKSAQRRVTLAGALCFMSQCKGTKHGSTSSNAANSSLMFWPTQCVECLASQSINCESLSWHLTMYAAWLPHCQP
jgi:hypothetical protein